LIGICLAFLTGSTFTAGAAINCEFQRLRQTHEILAFCGEEIDAASEARYVQLTKEFEARSLPEPAPWDGVDKIHGRLAQTAKEQVCKATELSSLKREFLEHVSEAGMAPLRNLLSQPRNPREGDC
jgi:hypothetical protein